MIALLRSTDGNPDSRFEKYLKFLDRAGVSRLTMCWDRFGLQTPGRDALYYRRPSAYGMGARNMLGLLGFNAYLWRQLWRRRRDYKVVHAADFDTALPAVLAKWLLGKRMIYDIYDWYIDSRNVRNPLLRGLISALEWLCIRSADVTVICEEGRRRQIRHKPRRLWVLPNIPVLDHAPAPRPERTPGSPVRLVYVGILSDDRGLDLLPRLARECPDVEVTVAGFGPLAPMMEEAAGRLPNFRFLGRVDYAEALRLMADGDIIYAAYHKTNPNQVLAAPNKYYEGLALGRPVITTEGTLVGDAVSASDTGYVIGEGDSDLTALFRPFDEEAWKRKSSNAARLWRSRWSRYVDRFMSDEYIPFIRTS